ncbi:hypothetical protein IWW34DRAFT_887008 [Fusarium oxysporum f. sp. albedinis]|nr:hypothetical protein IWW34DRAFT_887008 [Fusarium oxysporum f. sp. albedinis]KAJ0134587.1 putative proline-specific permease put4 [Fusarium oxysporum f. sp. albedinis]KAJ0135071.1 Uncharacterized protein HZ326_21880 [Fusarium oxysporum f. sp. albedinis]KAK2469825.1 hypothetical protein H9L39_18640 [Fusarium oxysporum f. sp. albedinis]
MNCYSIGLTNTGQQSPLTIPRDQWGIASSSNAPGVAVCCSFCGAWRVVPVMASSNLFRPATYMPSQLDSGSNFMFPPLSEVLQPLNFGQTNNFTPSVNEVMQPLQSSQQTGFFQPLNEVLEPMGDLAQFNNTPSLSTGNPIQTPYMPNPTISNDVPDMGDLPIQPQADWPVYTNQDITSPASIPQSRSPTEGISGVQEDGTYPKTVSAAASEDTLQALLDPDEADTEDGLNSLTEIERCVVHLKLENWTWQAITEEVNKMGDNVKKATLTVRFQRLKQRNKAVARLFTHHERTGEQSQKMVQSAKKKQRSKKGKGHVSAMIDPL